MHQLINIANLKKGKKCVRGRYKQIDVNKINYVLMNNKLNQLLQFYYSDLLPKLSQIQNCQSDSFVKEILNLVQQNDMESCTFVVEFYKGSNIGSFIPKIDESKDQENQYYLSDEIMEFCNLIQFELESPQLNEVIKVLNNFDIV